MNLFPEELYFVQTVASLAFVNFLIVVFIYLIDRLRPEPVLELTKAFFLGITAGGILLSIKQLDDFSVLSGKWLGPSIQLLWLALLEEVFKLLPILLIVRSFKYFDEPIDGMIYSAMVASGFAFFEDVGYSIEMPYPIPLFVLARSIPGHVLFTMIMGYFVGRMAFEQKVKSKELVFKGLLFATLAHAIFNFLILRWSFSLGVGFVIILVVINAYLVLNILKHPASVRDEIKVKELESEPKMWHMSLHLTSSIGYTTVWWAILGVLMS